MIFLEEIIQIRKEPFEEYLLLESHGTSVQTCIKSLKTCFNRSLSSKINQDFFPFSQCLQDICPKTYNILEVVKIFINDHAIDISLNLDYI